MGCSGSAPIEEVDFDAIPACDGKPAELTPSQSLAQSSTIRSAAHAEIQPETEEGLQARPPRVEREGAVCDDVCQQAGRGMELLCAVTKASTRAAMLSMPGTPQISFGNEGAVETRPNTTICWYRYRPLVASCGPEPRHHQRQAEVPLIRSAAAYKLHTVRTTPPHARA